jgi:RHS repeat-associated protein
MARFKYDALNRRVARQDAAGQWTYFAFDMSGQPLSELASSGSGLIPVRDYVWLESQPLVQLEYPGPAGGNEGYAYYFHVDHLGMPRALTNANGQPVWSATVLPNGEALESTTPDPLSGGTVVTNLRLPGQYDERLLGSLGLQGPRWYLPGVGRYLELDPIALAGGFNGAYGPDWYNYAYGNPLRWTDFEGMASYRRTQPLHAIANACGDKCAELNWKYNPLPLYHQFTCVVRDGKEVPCGGLDPSASPFWSPGKPTEDHYDPNKCKHQVQPDNDCYEQCLVRKWGEKRPQYSILWTQCQEYDFNVNEQCRVECKAPGLRWWERIGTM